MVRTSLLDCCTFSEVLCRLKGFGGRVGGFAGSGVIGAPHGLIGAFGV